MFSEEWLLRLLTKVSFLALLLVQVKAFFYQMQAWFVAGIMLMDVFQAMDGKGEIRD